MAEASLAAVRFGLYGLTGLAFGLPAFCLWCRRGWTKSDFGRAPIAPLLICAGLGGLLLSAFGFLLLGAAMTGADLQALDRETVGLLVAGTAPGWAFLVRSIALVTVIYAGFTRPPHLSLAAIAGAIALATLAWSGHAAATEGMMGALHRIADILHLWAAGLWFGALLVLLWMAVRGTPDPVAVRALHHTLADFSRLGTLIVAALIATGIGNLLILVGPANILSLGTTSYGQALILKLMLFGAMLTLAALNRFRLTPMLAAGNQRRTITRLRISLTIETAAVLAIFALVGHLGLLAPAAD